MYRSYNVNLKDCLEMRTGTDGFQPKFLYEDKFIKSQCEIHRVLRDDWSVEYIASLICKYYGIYAVEQTPCKLNITNNNIVLKRMGVVSKNYELEGLHFISCERLLEMHDTTVKCNEYRQLDALSKLYWLAEKNKFIFIYKL